MTSRINEIDALLNVWPTVADELRRRQLELVERLVSQESEQTRGAIKELRYLIDLPSALKVMRDHLAAGLSENSDPAQ